MKAGSIPGAPQASHANTSIFLLRNSISFSFSWRGSQALTRKNFSRSSSMTTSSRSSHFASPTIVLGGKTRVFNCYKFSSAEAKDFASSRYETASTTHCLAVGWQPRISRTWSPDGNFTFWCNEEATTPRAWSQGLPTMAI